MIKKIIFWVVMIVVFVSLSLTILIAALGYKVNWLNYSVRQTSLLWLKGSEKNVNIFLDGKKIDDHLPTRINYVSPGWREIRVTKNHYYDWTKNIYVNTDVAYEFRDISFFYKNAVPEVLDKNVYAPVLDNVALPINITAIDGELLANDKLVTRFFSNPLFYQWNRDGRHIIFQIDKSIRVIDLDGQNDNLLVDLESDKQSVFTIIENAKYLLYKDGDLVKKVRIK